MPSFGSCEPIITDYPSPPPPPPSIITNHASQTAIIRPPSPSSNSIATIQLHRQSIHVALSLCRHVRVSCFVLMSCILYLVVSREAKNITRRPAWGRSPVSGILHLCASRHRLRRRAPVSYSPGPIVQLVDGSSTIANCR